LTVLLQALGLGLSTGVFCLGFCYPVLAPLLLSREGERPGGSLAALALFLLGRLLAYLLVGLAVGLAGELAPRFAGSAAASWATAALGLLLVLYGVVERLPRWEICRVAQGVLSRRGLLLPLGLLAGLSPCPPFLLAIAAAVGTRSALRGALFFLLFFVGTSVYLLPFALSWLPARSRTLRAGSRLAAVVAGAWYLWLGLRGLAG
jgi:sulfite exporter TauE/SafE